MRDPEKCRITVMSGAGPAQRKGAADAPAAQKANVQAAPPRPVLTAEQVAYMAFVKIKLTALKPHIGPPPSINR